MHRSIEHVGGRFLGTVTAKILRGFHRRDDAISSVASLSKWGADDATTSSASSTGLAESLSRRTKNIESKFMPEEITLYGFPVSPHVRAARLAFAEKAVGITFESIGFDQLAAEAYAVINPFRKMPALTHGAVKLYETPALMSYAETIGAGPALEPSEAAARALMWQFVGIAQNYLYPVGVMQLYFHNVLAGLFGVEAKQDVAESAINPTSVHLDVLERALAASGSYLAGDRINHADLYCGAMVDYIGRTRDGAALIHARSKVSTWLEGLRGRESFKQTFAPMLVGTDQT